MALYLEDVPCALDMASHSQQTLPYLKSEFFCSLGWVECWLGSYTSLLRLKEISLQPWIFPKCSHFRTWASLNAIVFVRYSRPYLLLLLVQSFSRVWLFATPWTAALQPPMSFTISWSVLKLMSHWVSDAIQPSHPLSSPSPSAFCLSQHQGLF